MDKVEPAIFPRIVSDPPGLLQARRPQVALNHAQYNLFFFVFIDTTQISYTISTHVFERLFYKLIAKVQSQLVSLATTIVVIVRETIC